jgi:hypothetical protein
MPSSQSWNSVGSKTSTSKPFPSSISGDTSSYSVEIEANLDNNKNVTNSKLTLQDIIKQGNNTQTRDLATSTDGGKTWIPTKDSEGKSILSSTQIAALYNGNKFNKSIKEQVEKTVKSNGGTDSQVKQLEKKSPTPTQNPTPTPGSDQKETLTEEDLNVEQIQGDGRKSYGNLIYPTSLTTNKQDYIKFTIFNYKASKLDKKSATNLKKNPYIETESIGSIILPIQPSISDNNVVDWGGKQLSPVDIAALSLSSAGMTGSPDEIGKVLSQLGDTVTKNEDVKKAIILYLKQKATNVEGLLSRFGGAIVNPNLELLFQGPTLRPFNFTFRLSPRSEGEATQVRSIIRAFKEAMAPQVSNGGLFLATPRVFNISYHTPGKEMHPSINRIKTCALQSCNVDYTPDGSYMTFNDDNRTMTSYNLTLQFSELEPVTSKDYFDKNKPIPYDHIGY